MRSSLLLCGHTPYRQWKLYRQTHLLIFTTRDDPGSDELGERIAACLSTALPDSRARVARAPHAPRIASLITSSQADVAVLFQHDDIVAARGQVTGGGRPCRASPDDDDIAQISMHQHVN